MTQNLENALHGLLEARTAIFLETGKTANVMEQEEALEDIQIKINEVEETIKAYKEKENGQVAKSCLG